MAAPDTKHGHAKLANELLDQLYVHPFNGAQARILFWLFRDCYGWRRKWGQKMSGRDIADKIHLSWSTVQVALMVLLDAKIIQREGDRWAINSNFDRWLIRADKVAGKRASCVVTAKQAIDEEVAGKRASNGVAGKRATGRKTGQSGGRKTGHLSVRALNTNTDLMQLRSTSSATQVSRTRGQASKPLTTTATAGSRSDDLEPAEYRINTPLQRVMCAYKVALGLDPHDREWDKANWSRYIRAGKKLLGAFGGNHNPAIDWIDGFSAKMTEAGRTWTLDTAAKLAWDDPEVNRGRIRAQVHTRSETEGISEESAERADNPALDADKAFQQEPDSGDSRLGGRSG